MPGTSGAASLPYPLAGEIPDGPGGFLALIQRLSRADPVASWSNLPAAGDFDGQEIPIQDIDVYAQWTGTGGRWIPTTIPKVPTATYRGQVFPSPVQGDTVIRTDLGGIQEMYYAAYNATTNPMGANPAGWYIPDGTLLAQAYRDDTTASILAPASVTTIPGLSAIGVCNGQPVAARFQVLYSNAGSGAARTLLNQLQEDGTSRGTGPTWTLDTGGGGQAQRTFFQNVIYTPPSGRHTWTLQETANLANAVQRFMSEITIRSAVPRS